MTSSLRVWVSVALLAGLASRSWAADEPKPAPAPAALPSSEQIDKLIHDLQEKILSFQTDQASLIVRAVPPPPPPPAAGPAGGGAAVALAPAKKEDPTILGTVVDFQPPGLHFKTADGKVLALNANDIGFLEMAGHFEPDNAEPMNPGGHTAMAMWALACSDMDPKDARWKKAIDAYLHSTPPPGTYSLSFRLNTFSHLARWGHGPIVNDYKKIIGIDLPYIMKGMDRDGLYNYTCFPGPGLQPWQKPTDFKPNPNAGWGFDNSNTQFGVFGMWAAEDALPLENSNPYWALVDKHWQETQNKEGGWSYARESEGATMNMTDAGMNSLYLVVDKYWSRQVGANGYVRLRGFTYNEAAQAGMARTFAAINRGWAWLDKHRGEAPQNGMYHEYGLQRLGLASGRKYIAGDDWLEHVVRASWHDGNSNYQPGPGVLEDCCWRVMCLAFGRAPVLFNKLEHGDEQDWNYYFRDVAFLTDWISHETERRYNWQIVNLKGTMEDLQDAPVLLISGYKKLILTEDEQAKLKKYLDMGGTVMIHPHNNSKLFKDTPRPCWQTCIRPKDTSG